MSTFVPSVSLNLELKTLEEARGYCKILASTELVPKSYRGKPDDIMVAGQMGARLGLDIFQALQSIASINGVPSVYGDAGLAIVRASGFLEEFDEWLEIDGQRVKEMPNLIEAAEQGHRIVQWCKSKRKGAPHPRLTSYSVTDAKVARLWLKKGYNGQETPWCTSPGRMLMFRARGYNLRDEFSDVLKGMRFAEEVQDYDMDMQPDASGTYKPVPPTEEENGKKSSALGTVLKASVPKTMAMTPALKDPDPEPTMSEPVAEHGAPESLPSAPTPTEPADRRRRSHSCQPCRTGSPP